MALVICSNMTIIYRIPLFQKHKMDAMSLEDLEENFLSKCKAQSLYLELRDYGEDETCIQQMMVSSFSSLISCF